VRPRKEEKEKGSERGAQQGGKDLKLSEGRIKEDGAPRGIRKKILHDIKQSLKKQGTTEESAFSRRTGEGGHSREPLGL